MKLKKSKSFLGLKLMRRMIRALGGTDSVWYINGAETLPPPLTPEEESEALASLPLSRENAEKLINLPQSELPANRAILHEGNTENPLFTIARIKSL